MAQYMISVIHDWDADDMSSEEMQATFESVDRFNSDITAAGQWVFGAGLQHPSTARVVDGVRGAATVTDGPFAETKEQLGGFWVVSAPDAEAARELARRASEACARPVELRPLEEGPEEGPEEGQGA